MEGGTWRVVISGLRVAIKVGVSLLGIEMMSMFLVRVKWVDR
jgi:hypothetical protein